MKKILTSLFLLFVLVNIAKTNPSSFTIHVIGDSTVSTYNQSVYPQDRKSTRLNSSHVRSSYAVFCLKKKVIHLAAGTSGFVAAAAVGRRVQRDRGGSIPHYLQFVAVGPNNECLDWDGVGLGDPGCEK